MANSVNFILCFLFYFCLVIDTNFKFKVLSEDIPDGDTTVRNINNDKTHYDKLDFVNTQTGNYNTKSFVLQEKTCGGKDCKSKAPGKLEDNAHGRQRRKRRRHGHAKRKNSELPTRTSSSLKENPRKSKRPQNKHSQTSNAQGRLRQDGRRQRNRNRKGSRSKGNGNKQEKEKIKVDMKLPQRETDIKTEPPKIHGFRIISNIRPGIKLTSQEKDKIQPKGSTDIKASDLGRLNVVKAKERKSGTKQVDGTIPKTPPFQELEENDKQQSVLQRERGKIDTNNRRSLIKSKSGRHSKKIDNQNKKGKKAETEENQLYLSPDSLQLSPPSDGRNGKPQRFSPDALQLSPPSNGLTDKSSPNLRTHQNDRRNQYYRRHYYQRAPAGVGRLEQRLHPSLWTSVSSLKHNIETVLFKLREKVNRVNYDHDMLYNTTRYDVMNNVREQLKHIAEENDRAYDVVLDASELIRYIYLRAHNHGLMSPGPKQLREHVRIAELNVKDFSPDFKRTDNLLHHTRDTFRKVMEAKRTCMRQESKTKGMLHKVKNRVPKRELDDMDRVLRRLTKQSSDIQIHYAKLRLLRYKNRYSRMEKYVENARNFSRMSFSDLKEAQKHFLQNKAYQRKINEAKENRGRQKRSTDLSKAELKRLTARAYRHARNLQKATETIERSLVPLVIKATNFTGGKTQNVVKAEIRVIIGRVENLIKKYERKFDEIRILLGDDDILRERCEYLIQLGSFSEELTPIDCEDFGIYSGSGDLPVSTTTPSTIQPKSSTPATVSTTLAPEGTDEGSATSDFEFVESKDDKKEKAAEDTGGGLFGWWPSDDPLAGNRDLFREKLQEIALSNRTKSEQIYATVEKIETRSQALSERWNRIVNEFNFNEKYVDLATSVSHSWADAKPYIERIKQTIVSAHDFITKQVEKINNKLPTILQKANKTLGELRQNNTDDKSKESVGVSVIQDLISAVDQSKSNMASIKNIRVAQTPPCKKVQTFATQLRTGIAELRKKIERARDITASMKMTVAMGGDEYISVPLKEKKELLPTTSFEMCIKPSGTDMNVARFYDNKTSIYSVHMKDSLPIVSVYDNKGEKFGDVEGSSSFENDEWYTIRINRFGHTVKLSTRKLSESVESQATMVNAFPDLKPFQPSPITANIGGLPRNAEDDGNSQFNGCIGEVMVDGRNVGLHSHSGKTHICPGRCSSKPNVAMVFEGNGYVKFPLRLVSATYDIDNIRLNFTTRQRDGIIFLLNHRTQMFQVLISLTEGSLHVEARTKRGTTVLRSGLGTYANGKTHNILIKFGNDQIDVMTDNGTDTFTAETRTQEITPRLDSGIYLGGLGSTSQPLSGKAKLRSLVGCISNLELNEKEIPMFLMEESKNAHLGSCTNNIWTQCVWFDSNSTPIELDKTEEGSRIYTVVNSESRGTVLQYKRGEDFDIEISVTADGISIYDNKEEESKMMHIPFQQWYILEITDQDKKIHVSSHGEKITISYSCGGWFGCDKATYTLLIGGTDTDGTPLTGGISQILVNDKPVPLTQYIDDHNLAACHHQPSEPLENEIIEKPICK